MPKRKFQLSPEAIESRKAREREIRDLNNKLRKKYRQALIDKFFRENYFIQPAAVEKMILRCDSRPVDVDRASIAYKQAIQENFNL